ncbi:MULTISPECIES: hypothetical protein [unclassified Oceanispirochaeta]|uniref:hypothetical protein n=1 Tax=unclassified Oceanispirochaeta TaxID=2635722 RepID=UPI0011C06413|nr:MULTISPECIES: hypothetical protein [unclassified Oceanispirochaeta]MBF9018972.1 hypothetical protein [Oceanispirochaeta sp. M2]NPD75472.1 hypothetical protein [Oceanispirochaeta sp. M1]
MIFLWVRQPSRLDWLYAIAAFRAAYSRLCPAAGAPRQLPLRSFVRIKQVNVTNVTRVLKEKRI